MTYKIKASAITNLTDARYFAARDVRWMGFCLDPASPDYIQPQIARAVMEWVEGPLFVGEFGQQPVEQIRETAEQMGLKAVQLCHDTPEETIREFRSYFVILEIVPTDIFFLPAVRATCDALRGTVEVFLINFAKAGVEPDDWEVHPELRDSWKDFFKEMPSIVETSGDAGQVLALMAALQPYGLSIKGGDEEKPGYKSFDEMDIILDELTPL